MQNFVRAVGLLPGEVKRFFGQLGVDLEKPTETSWYPGSPTEASGDAWYHVCGEILERVEPDAGLVDGETIRVSEKFDAYFSPDCYLLAEDFPRPCFQMDVRFQLPWVLEEPNPDVL